ncbi:MAG TPA: ankyrin repeat domain-containing protein [Puia sp.]|nr:ankyrin repeat domain-containing protein [Puia sp.]
MNKFIEAVKSPDLRQVKEMVQKEPGWLTWSEDSGKNALHYLCALPLSKDPSKAADALPILKYLIKAGMDINAVHKIPDERCGFFPATPLWYAYTRGRNEKLVTWLLANGADPEHCMFAIAWYDDVKAAGLFKKYGAGIDDGSGGDSPFLAAFTWKKFNVMEWFLKNGADVNFRDKEGNTALFYAVKKKYKIGLIGLLLQFGADPDIENQQGISPRKLAEMNRQQKILKLFTL